jgi:hypothetical protein
MEPGFEALFSLLVEFRPDRRVIFDLTTDEDIEQSRDLSGASRGGSRRTEFSLEAAKIVPQGSTASMQGL